jgi:hypothetical protein
MVGWTRSAPRIWESALRERRCRKVQHRAACPAPDIRTKRFCYEACYTLDHELRIKNWKLLVYDFDLLVDYLPGKTVAGHSCLCLFLSLSSYAVGVSEILDEIKSLPTEQRWQILQRTREMLGAEIPESFKRGMEEIARGEVIELDEALEGLDQQE